MRDDCVEGYPVKYTEHFLFSIINQIGKIVKNYCDDKFYVKIVFSILRGFSFLTCTRTNK